MKKCPFCAEDIQDAAIKCRYCGEMLEGTAAVAAPVPPWGTVNAPAPVPAAAPQQAMKTCLACKAEIPAEATRCQKCGSMIPSFKFERKPGTPQENLTATAMGGTAGLGIGCASSGFLILAGCISLLIPLIGPFIFIACVLGALMSPLMSGIAGAAIGNAAKPVDPSLRPPPSPNDIGRMEVSPAASVGIIVLIILLMSAALYFKL